MSRKTLGWALILAASLAGAFWIWSRYSGGWSRLLEHAGRVPGGLWPAVLGLTLAFYLLDWLRLYCLLRLFDFRLAPLAGLRLSLVSDFVCGLTPVTELNLPTMVYFLGREGVPGPTAAAVVLTKSMTMTLWVCAAALVALGSDGARLPPDVAAFLPVSLACVAALTAAVGALALYPARVLAWTDSRLSSAGSGVMRSVYAGLRDTASSLSAIGGARNRWQWLTHAAAAGSIAAYAAVGYLLARGMGLELSAGRAAAAFSASLMVAYLAPVPGSIGVTEWATSYLLDPALTQEGMAVAILLRSLTCYAGMPLGGLICLAEGWRRGASVLGGK
ncbi:MAG: flippase-like domain-containing protein [Elusimicrobia bacterium]|nr:flippase-like domain-containing protein [Elusimicrobiota bacterium]